MFHYFDIKPFLYIMVSQKAQAEVVRETPFVYQTSSERQSKTESE